MLRNYRKIILSCLMSLSIIAYFKPNQAHFVSAVGLNTQEVIIENQGLSLFLQAINDFAGSIQIKDISNGNLQAFDINQMEANFLTDLDSQRLTYEDTAYEALLYSYEIDNQWLELYLLFENSQLIYVNAFDYSFNNRQEDQSKVYKGFSLINNQTIIQFDHYLEASNLIEAMIDTYYESDLIASRPYSSILMNFHLINLQEILDYLQIEAVAINDFIDSFIENPQKQSLDQNNKLNKAESIKEIDNLMKVWQGKWVNGQEFLNNYREWQNQIQGRDEIITLNNLKEQLGQPSQATSNGRVRRLTYALQTEDYQIFDFYFTENQLVYYTKLELNEAIFQSISQNHKNRLQNIPTQDLKLEELYGILGLPTYQIYYLDLPIYITQWLRYDEGELISITLTDNQGQITIEGIEE